MNGPQLQELFTVLYDLPKVKKLLDYCDSLLTSLPPSLHLSNPYTDPTPS